MIDSREVEAKFEIDEDGISVLRAIESIGHFVVTSRRDVIQEDVYFDTRDAALAAARCSLRIRVKDSGAEMTFKGRREIAPEESMAHIASRLEDEIALDDHVAQRLLAGDWQPSDDDLPPLARALKVTGKSRLLPMARLRNTRTVISLEAGERQRIEMAIDCCEGTRIADGRVVRFNEVELEAKRATRETLAGVAGELQTTLPGIRPNYRTKLERVLQ